MDTQSKIFFENLLTQAVENKAQGLHLSAGSPPILKISGGLKPLDQESVLSNENIEEIVFSFLPSADQATLVSEKEITIVHNFKPQLRFKVNVFYQKGNLSASFAYIPNQVKNLAELGLEQVAPVLERFPKGVIIISGPFGSGKSTLITSIIETINNTKSKYIITIEDPIEFVFTNKKGIIEQRQVGRDVKSFEQGLDFLSEEKVDIIALSEIEDPKAIRAAIEMAQGGRLVIFQIDADSSIKTIENIVTNFPPKEAQTIRNLLSENLAAVINLHLFKKIGGGSVVIPEILINNSASKSVIRDGKFFQLANILQTGNDEGMVSLGKAVSDLVAKNIISAEEARAQLGE
ncbi:Flp pilus assembly complex ATPase component TadA [Candidatus Falkowbacteria bacterium]|nr:Flp pilus assembly complex ATPase component TadA [Candidatus Falkowbacteria bacterium]